MAPRDDRITLTVREWDANCKVLECLQGSVEKLERENIVYKTKAAIVMMIAGAAWCIVSSIITALVVAYILRHQP